MTDHLDPGNASGSSSPEGESPSPPPPDAQTSQRRRKNILIVGAPRSGTSLTAAIFSRKGYHVGRIENERLREGDDHNPFGYFEADELIEQNVAILRAAGFPHHNTWLFETITRPVIERLQELEPQESQRAFLASHDSVSPWVWKDPRLCFTLPVWWKAMDRANTAVVVVERDPLDVYRSFRRMGWAGRGSAARNEVLAKLELHALGIREAVKRLEIPILQIDYDDFSSRPDQVAAALSRFCDLDIQTAELNFRTQLNHSTLRGRISAGLRIAQMALPRGVVKGVERLLPRRLVALLFPERRWAGSSRGAREDDHEVSS